MKSSFFHPDHLIRLRVLAVTGICLLLFGRQACHAAPSNDNLANAQVIPTGTSFSVSGSDGGATQEAFEMAPGYPGLGSHSVWYAWTPSISGSCVVYAERTDGHTSSLGFFKGTMPSGATVLPTKKAYVEAGQEYRIVVGNDLYSGSFTLLGNVTAGPPLFFTGEAALANGVYYLAFSDGNYFGYYSFLSDTNYIYHFDLGYEYVFDAEEGDGGVYLYDFKSDTFFYTSPTFPFPYLYDFTLNTVLYYYPDSSTAGHYNTNGIRYFYDFATGKVITK